MTRNPVNLRGQSTSLKRERFEQAGQEAGDGVVAGGEHLLGAVVGLLREQLDGVGRRVGRADVHPVERRAEIALVVGGGGA
ncbi:hypothetical protein OG568_50790 (plasmid) [Streptomyces sp. NBC_01450]|uniref:hypothetical protein n=1 Tax=Streptomyces sp. NBC_01450 TaxID=2903871 RepID=UPI002E31D9C2|nr:hypothetical protein [Streptomyces sp. NBC_01450]